MNGPQPQDPDALLEAYLDGALSEARRAEFEQRLARDAGLHAALDAQRRIDAALLRLYAPPGDARLRALLAAAGVPADALAEAGLAARRSPVFRLPYALAAALLLLAVGASVSVWWYARRSQSRFALVSVDRAYAQFVAEGWDPNQWCATDSREFAAAVWYKTQQGLLLPPAEQLPPGVEQLGLKRCPCIAFGTLTLMLRVEGRPVAVFIAPLKHEQPQKLPECGPLHLFRREIGKAVLYELTPFDRPTVLELFYDPQQPEEWYQISPW